MNEEMVDIVDDNDNVIDIKPRSEVEKKALLHRSANVIVMNKENKVFVHKRNPNKMMYPGKWDVKCGGIVNSGEDYETAAMRELKEELGLDASKLEFLFKSKYRSKTNNANRKVFLHRDEGSFQLQKNEISEGRFMAKNEIEELYNNDMLSPTAKIIFDEIKRLNIIK